MHLVVYRSQTLLKGALGKFLQKFDVAVNVICQACTRRWYSIYFCHCLFKCFFPHFLIVYQFVVK